MGPMQAEWEAVARQLWAMPWTEFAKAYESCDTRTRADLLRMRMRFDVAAFLTWCWPETYSRPWNPFHAAVLRLDDPAAEDRTRNVQRAWAAPRGIAKTTLARGRVVHRLVYGLEPFVVWMSAEMQLALSNSRTIRSMLASPNRYLAHIAGGAPKVTGTDGAWQVQLPGQPARGLLCKSFGTQVRGANLNGQRPTWVIVDDGERPDRVVNPEQRQRWQSFLDDDVIKAGPIEGGLIVDWLGTVLHPDAILARCLKSPVWRARKWSAVKSWPERMDLWERCGAVYLDLSLGDEELRHACAQAFFEANRAAMERGAEVLDPVALPLFACFRLIWANGLRSFLREQQNEPRDHTAAIFTSSRFTRCRVVEDERGERWVVGGHNRRVRLADCRLTMRWDPSVGDPGGDFAAVVVLARDRHGYGYVLDAWVRKAPTTAQLAAVWALAERWGVSRVGLEANGFQRNLANDLERERNARRERGDFWQLHADCQVTSTNKVERIATLEVPVSNGWLQFAEGLDPMALMQFDDFPQGSHDDFPDVVEAAWSDSGGVTPSMGQERLR